MTMEVEYDEVYVSSKYNSTEEDEDPCFSDGEIPQGRRVCGNEGKPSLFFFLSKRRISSMNVRLICRRATGRRQNSRPSLFYILEFK